MIAKKSYKLHGIKRKKNITKSLYSKYIFKQLKIKVVIVKTYKIFAKVMFIINMCKLT